MLNKIDIDKVASIALKAGEEIMKIYKEGFEVDLKSDNSPLTKADLASNEIICSSLRKLYPDIPIISEENAQTPYEIRKEWEYLWLIDPLDGTKEFIKRNGEFTVNIALIHNQTPIAGVIYAPVLKELYKAQKGKGAYKNDKKINPTKQKRDTFRVVASRSHLSKETQEFINSIKTDKKIEIISRGSSLKFCLIAENQADIYPRLSPTMEWDTAAGDAIVRECNKEVVRYEDNKPLIYNKEDLRNPWFIAK